MVFKNPTNLHIFREFRKEMLTLHHSRGVAQLASASGLGPEGRKFESFHPDKEEVDYKKVGLFFVRQASHPGQALPSRYIISLQFLVAVSVPGSSIGQCKAAEEDGRRCHPGADQHRPGNRKDGLVEKDIRTFKAAEFHLMLFPSS